MKQILFIISLTIGILLSSLSLADIKKGDKYWIYAVCRGAEAGEIHAKSVEKSMGASPALIILVQQGVCGRLPGKTVIPIERVIRALVDWEGDEAYLVQLAHKVTLKPIDYYTVVWPQNKFVEPSNGSSNRLLHTPQYNISTHLAPVKAGERVWIGGMCRVDKGAAMDLFLSVQTESMDDVNPHIKAGRCISLGGMHVSLIAAVLINGIDNQGNSYWLVQLVNNKKEQQPWYSLAWECTLEANLQLPGSNCP